MSKEEIALQITLSALDSGVLELVEQNETNNNIDNNIGLNAANAKIIMHFYKSLLSLLSED